MTTAGQRCRIEYSIGTPLTACTVLAKPRDPSAAASRTISLAFGKGMVLGRQAFALKVADAFEDGLHRIKVGGSQVGATG